ncbi:MAG: alpha/beta family hydrolase [Bdellovibrionota bacterium]
MKLLLIAIFTFSLSSAWAADRQVTLRTSDGRQVFLDIYNPGGRSALLLAPGAGCGPRLDMYDMLAAAAQAKGYTLVRLYWAYCVASPQGKPSDDLGLEREDFLTALRFVKSGLGYSDAQIVVGGKSQGTYVSQRIFAEEKQISALLLLTPLCTDDEIDPKNPKNVFGEEYPSLGGETRPVLLAQGDVDPLCYRVHFEEYLAGKPANFSSAKVKGDHGFGLKNPDGSYNAELGLANIRQLAALVGAWFSHQ